MTHWSSRLLAGHLKIGDATVARAWREYGVQPWRAESFRFSTDPQLEAKVVDVVGLYLHPPENAVVLRVDEKSQIQALDRTAPILPLQPGLAERRSHDYVRHGTSTLFAALEIATGQVIAACKRRHRHQEFLAFLKQVTRAYRSASCTWSWTTTPPTSTPRSASGSRRVGHAMEYFNERYAALTTELQEVLDGIRLSEDEPDQRLLTRLWAENNDARRYVVLGDPAVRLCRPPAGDGGA